MPVPIICLDEEVRHFAERYREHLSKPQYQHFVTVLLGLMQCEGRRVLSELLRQVGEAPSLAGLSRFLSCAPWDEQWIAEQWLRQFRDHLQPQVSAEVARKVQAQPKRRGRPKVPLVTGYLIGDDSTMHKPKGKKMQGLGKHHSTTHEHQVVGHSLVAGLYVLLGRRCPLAPRLYRQQKICKKEEIAFQSKINVMERLIRTFEPITGTVTHVLLDSWYSAKVLWKAARERGFLITTGIKSNRSLRIVDESQPQGWRWQELREYAASLRVEDYVQLSWPRGQQPETVYVHVISTRVRKLYCCQVIIIRRSLQEPLSQARYWASSDLEADPATLLEHIAARWDIEVLFGDSKEELGLDQYQLMSATALLRFWTLAMLAYIFLEEERDRLQQHCQHAVTIGQARREIQRRHRRTVLNWLHGQFLSGVQPDSLYELFAA
jgi:DDE superfamily endonuclease